MEQIKPLVYLKTPTDSSSPNVKLTSLLISGFLRRLCVRTSYSIQDIAHLTQFYYGYYSSQLVYFNDCPTKWLHNSNIILNCNVIKNLQHLNPYLVALSPITQFVDEYYQIMYFGYDDTEVLAWTGFLCVNCSNGINCIKPNAITNSNINNIYDTRILSTVFDKNVTSVSHARTQKDNDNNNNNDSMEILTKFDLFLSDKIKVKHTEEITVSSRSTSSAIASDKDNNNNNKGNKLTVAFLPFVFNDDYACWYTYVNNPIVDPTVCFEDHDSHINNNNSDIDNDNKPLCLAKYHHDNEDGWKSFWLEKRKLKEMALKRQTTLMWDQFKINLWNLFVTNRLLTITDDIDGNNFKSIIDYKSNIWDIIKFLSVINGVGSTWTQKIKLPMILNGNSTDFQRLSKQYNPLILCNPTITKNIANQVLECRCFLHLQWKGDYYEIDDNKKREEVWCVKFKIEKSSHNEIDMFWYSKRL